MASSSSRTPRSQRAGRLRRSRSRRLLIGRRSADLLAAGAEIGWGFQLQSPLFVAVMIYILFAVGLNLSGAFSFGFQLAGIGSDLRSRPGYAGSFFTGALATAVATPCTAPFMASAIGCAVPQPWDQSVRGCAAPCGAPPLTL